MSSCPIIMKSPRSLEFLGCRLLNRVRPSVKVDALELQKLARLYQRPVGYFTGEEITSSGLPEEVAHLARAASKLSDQDRQQLAQFAEYLPARSVSEKE